jgi:hypothetical protein
MLKSISALILCGGLFLGTAIPAYSHHAASSEFNMDKTFEIKGALTQIEWINPHAYLHFDVVGPDGKTNSWAMLLAGTTVLRKSGIAKQMLAVGQPYTITFNPSKKGKPTGLLNTLTFPDGRVFTLGGPKSYAGKTGQQ